MQQRSEVGDETLSFGNVRSHDVRDMSQRCGDKLRLEASGRRLQLRAGDGRIDLRLLSETVVFDGPRIHRVADSGNDGEVERGCEEAAGKVDQQDRSERPLKRRRFEERASAYDRRRKRGNACRRSGHRRKAWLPRPGLSPLDHGEYEKGRPNPQRAVEEHVCGSHPKPMRPEVAGVKCSVHDGKDHDRKDQAPPHTR
jgi:hypothetical protein